MKSRLSRREFAVRVGAAVGAVIAAPHLVDSLAEARQPKGVPSDVIQLNSNENPYGPSPKAQDAIKKSRKIAARYPDALEDEVIETIARLHSVQPENVLLGCGSGEILRMADLAFLTAGKNVVVAEPTFEAVLAYARVTRAEPVKVPLTPDFRHDLPAMAAACNPNTGLVYVCNPNNPTATIVRRDEMAAFFDRVPRSTIILLDEAYHHFVDNKDYASGFDWGLKQPNLIVVRTFSKVFGMAGMRLGYAVSTKENISAMRVHAFWNNSNASVLEAALASLNDTAHVAQQRRLNSDTRNWLVREMEREGRRVMPSETNFIMIDVGGDVSPVIAAFRERKILVGRKFPSLPNWLRVSIGTRKEQERFLAAFRAIVPAQAATPKAA
jgi:histidinol-phosphate aminotransferase